MTAGKPFLIGVVGPCGSGKTTLTQALDSHGYTTRHIAQEHSYVRDMWKRITNPDVLIFLQASYPVTCQRRQMSNWSKADYNEQQRRLSHAYEHADLIIQTDKLSIDETREQVLAYLKNLFPHQS